MRMWTLCWAISFQTGEVYEISRELLMLVDGESSFVVRRLV